jgi:hypothetical protein
MIELLRRQRQVEVRNPVRRLNRPGVLDDREVFLEATRNSWLKVLTEKRPPCRTVLVRAVIESGANLYWSGQFGKCPAA